MTFITDRRKFLTLAGRGIAIVGHMLVAGYVGAIGGSFHKPCQSARAHTPGKGLLDEPNFVS